MLKGVTRWVWCHRWKRLCVLWSNININLIALHMLIIQGHSILRDPGGENQTVGSGANSFLLLL